MRQGLALRPRQPLQAQAEAHVRLAVDDLAPEGEPAAGGRLDLEADDLPVLHLPERLHVAAADADVVDARGVVAGG